MFHRSWRNLVCININILREDFPKKTPFLLAIAQIPPPPRPPLGQHFHFKKVSKSISELPPPYCASLLKDFKINLGRRPPSFGKHFHFEKCQNQFGQEGPPPSTPIWEMAKRKNVFLWKVFPQSHTKSNFKMNYENMNYGKNKIDCNDGHSSMSGHFCIYDLHKNVIQQQISKSITLWSKLLIENN